MGEAVTYEAHILLAPHTSVERLNDPAWRNAARGRIMYDSNSLQLLPIPKPVPLIIDHDKAWSIGQVESLWRCELDGYWTCANVTVTDPPAWLKRGTPASFEITAPQMSSFGDPILRHGYVTEVSVLSPGVEPAEPGARVLTYKPHLPPPSPVPAAPPRTVRTSPAQPVIVRQAKKLSGREEDTELRRRLEVLGWPDDVETVLEGLRRDLGYPCGIQWPR